MTCQSPIKRLRSMRRSMARKGGLESELKKLDHDSQPEKSVARAATNNVRLAALARMLKEAGLCLFACIIPGMV